MSDISISFPPWMVAWLLLGEATPFMTLVMVVMVAAFLFSRATGRVGPTRWLTRALVVVGGLWLGGISFWGAGLIDQIKTDLYQTRHHYRLDKATVMAGIAVPKGSWVSVDEAGLLYGIETDEDSAVTIDGAAWRGDIHLMLLPDRTALDRGRVKSATLAADAAIQGTPCRAGSLVQFSEGITGLEHCTLSRRTSISAEIEDDRGGKSRKVLVCAANQEVVLRALYGGLLERCVLAETATIGKLACVEGKEVLLSGDGLDTCTLAAAQPVGPVNLPAGTLVKFIRGRLVRFEMPRISAPLSISGVILPAGTVADLCDESGEVSWLDVPEDQYVTIEGFKLTGRMNFDCGKFQSGILYEDTSLPGRQLPRHAVVSSDDVLRPSCR
jgi:hypothetical protein